LYRQITSQIPPPLFHASPFSSSAMAFASCSVIGSLLGPFHSAL
jgi:hypothetical protein